MAGEKGKLHINLHLYDTDIPVDISPDYEPAARAAAKLITEKVNAYSSHYRTNKSEKEILYMVMLEIALNLEISKGSNDTKPYDDMLSKLTAEIEELLK